MLAAVGRGPVTSTDPAVAGEEAGKAIQIISDTAVTVQEEGWYFNSEVDYILTPSPVDGTITLPANCLRVKKNTVRLPKNYYAQADRNRVFTMRGNQGVNQLYDIANQTFSWIVNTDGYSVVQPLLTGALSVDMVLAFPFEDIPNAIRWLITCKAGHAWAVGRVPDQTTYRFTDEVLADADAKARAYDQDVSTPEAEESPHYAMMRRR